LDGLKGILDLRATQLLPFLLPTLLQPPMQSYHAQALEIVAQATGRSIHYSLSKILPALLTAIITSEDPKTVNYAITACDASVVAVGDNGVQTLLAELEILFANSDVKIKVQACRMAEVFMSKSKCDYTPYLASLIDPIIVAWNEKDPEVQKAGLSALSVLTQTVKNEILIYHLEYIKNSISTLASRMRFKKDANVVDGEFALRYIFFLPLKILRVTHSLYIICDHIVVSVYPRQSSLLSRFIIMD
jgi:hypothetical protein